MLIMVCGLPGTGKSFISKELAKRLDAEYLNSDSMRMKILSKRTYSEEEKAKIYSMMAEEAGRFLKEGKNVIVDATFYLRKHRQMMRKVAGKEGSSFFAIECTLAEDKIKQRLEKRKTEKSESEADYEVYLKVKEIFEPLEQEHLAVDMSSAEDALGKVLDYMGWSNE